MNSLKTKTFNLEIDDIVVFSSGWTPETRLWAAVLLKLYDDALYLKSAVLNFYDRLKELNKNKNFYENSEAKECFRHLESWERERIKIIHELNSTWIREVCEMIEFDYVVYRKKVYQSSHIGNLTIGEIKYWRTGFSTKIQPVTNEVIKNGIKHKKEGDLWEAV